jgi:hypothetical protein
MVFTCIYCGDQVDKERASLSHIIPDSLGGPIVLRNAVCRKCNAEIAKQVEDPFKGSWAWLIWMLGVRSRRQKLPTFKAAMNLMEQEREFTVRSHSRAPEIPPIFTKDPQGKEMVSLVGPTDYVSRKMAEYQNKYQNVVWTEQPADELKKKHIVFPIDVESLSALFTHRLAAKIAFEYWGLMRDPTTLLDNEYDDIRKLIRWGTTGAGQLCGLIADENLISRNLNISFPNHAICIVVHPSERKLGAVIVVFGLFYYWVELTSRYPISISLSELTVVSPIAKIAREAVLVGSARMPRLPWEKFKRPDLNRVQNAWRLARKKIEMSLDTNRSTA